MTFTTDDLKRLQKDIEMAYSCNGEPVLRGDKLSALLARLEAAEAVIAAYYDYITPDELEAIHKIWRKAAGK